MNKVLKCHWFAPARQPRALAIEARHRLGGWARIGRSGGWSLTNFGDELSAFVLEDATGRRVEWAPFGQEDVNAIGSTVVHYAREGGAGKIWGLGVHEPVLTAAEKMAISPHVLAIRGPNSRNHLELLPSTPMGDPGLLARSLAPTRAVRGQRKLLICHFSAFASATSRRKIRELQAAGFEVALPNLHPLEMVRRIAIADFVACSGLHGTVIAHAVGTPVELFTFSDDADVKPAYKYIDYFESLGEKPELVRWRDLTEPKPDHVARVARAEARGQRLSKRIDPIIESLYGAAESLR